MTRKKLVTALSIIYIMSGLWDIGIFLYPLAKSSSSIELDLAPLIGGVLALYVASYLWKLDEFGRKLAVFLLYVRVAINSAFMVWAFSAQKGVGRSWLFFLDQRVYSIENRYALQIFLFVGIIVALSVILFLSQSETKKIFGSRKADNSDAIVESG
ncbi:MAG TPA: hypothetical protein VIR02_06750 [Anaerolineales bacterium]